MEAEEHARDLAELPVSDSDLTELPLVCGGLSIDLAELPVCGQCCASDLAELPVCERGCQ